MNNKLLVALGILIVLLIVVSILFAFAHKAAPTTSTSGSTSTQFPLAPNSPSSSGSSSGTSSGSQTLNITTTQGTPIAVNNFENSSTTVKDPTGDGYYYMSGGLNVAATHAPYQIFYDSQHQYFGITLFSEPLGQYRIQAEDELMQELGIGQSQMCDLNYDISAGPGISAIYSSENIGFSFCPGAVALPQ